jgi:hypothetical protein
VEDRAGRCLPKNDANVSSVKQDENQSKEQLKE